jgi:hypothetical protein
MTSIALVGRELGAQASLLSYVDVFSLLALLSFCAAPIPLFIHKPKTAPPPEAFHAE